MYFNKIYIIYNLGMPLSVLSEKYLGETRKNKFIYLDNWGDIVLRNEAWICIKNLVYRLKIGEFAPCVLNNILRQQEKLRGCKEYELCSSCMERFWERLILETKKYINNNFFKNKLKNINKSIDR